MVLKPGVRVLGIKPELVIALMVADSIYRTAGHELVVTSVTEGTHSRGSIHYAGCAADLRTQGLDPARQHTLRDLISAGVGSDYDVVLEPDHIHVEYQPKNPY